METVDEAWVRLAIQPRLEGLLDEAALRHLMTVAWGAPGAEVTLTARADMCSLVERLDAPPGWREPVVADVLWRGVVTAREGDDTRDWPLCVPVLITERAGPREAMGRLKALRDAAARAGLARAASSTGRSGGLAPTWLAPAELFDDPAWAADDARDASQSRARRRHAALEVARGVFAREGVAVLVG
jgi:hypothetical protein